jgi:uncharacterized coiled-coil DUF342 family protein
MATSLVINILADAADAEKGLKQTEKSVGGLGDAVGKAGKAMALGAAAGAAGLVALGVDAFNAAAESQKIARETERVLATTGAAAWTSVPGVQALAEAISDKTGADDEAVQSGANLLLTFTKIKNEVGEGNNVFDRATEAALDMSTALGTDMSGSAIQLGKALNDPIKGMAALGKAGVSFSEDQKNQIRLLQESGDLLGAQKIILKEVETEFKGAAEAAGTPFDKLKVAIGNLQEDIGAHLIPPVMAAATVLTDNLSPAIEGATGFFKEHNEVVQALAVTGLVALAASYAHVVEANARLVAQGTVEFFTNLGNSIRYSIDFMKLAVAESGVLKGSLIALSTTALPVTVALAALAAIVYGFASAGEEGRKSADKFAQSLDVGTGSLPKLREAISSTKERMGQLNREFTSAGDRAAGLADVIIPFHNIENSMEDARGEYDKLNEAAQGYQDTLDKYTATVDLAIKKLTETATAAGQAAPNVDQLRVGLEALASAKKIDLTQPGASDQLVALFNSTTKVSAATVVQTDAQEKYNDAAATAKDKTDAYKQSLDALTGAHMSAAQAETNYSQNGLTLLKTLSANKAAVESMTDQFDASKASSLEHTAVVNNNNKAIQDNVKAALDLANATFQEQQGTIGSTAALQLASQGLTTHRDQLIKTMVQMGYNETQAIAYVDRLGLTPKNINTQMNLDNTEANRKADETKAKLISASGVYTATINADTNPAEIAIKKMLDLYKGAVNEARDRALAGTRAIIPAPPGLVATPHALVPVAAVGPGLRAGATSAPTFNIRINHTGLGVDSPRLQRDLVGALTRYVAREGRLNV